MSLFSEQSQKNFRDNSDPKNGVSICIARVFKNIPHWRIKKHFIDANLGFVERVDVIHVPAKQEGKPGYKRAYVHFAPGKWNMRDAQARQVLTLLQQKKEVTLEYEEPWFWKLTISTSKRPDSAPGTKPNSIAIKLAKERVKRPRKKIDLDSPVSMNSQDDPILARGSGNTPSPEQSSELQKKHLEKCNELDEEPDYGKYNHLSEQAANFMMEQDELEAQNNIKEISTY